jgi:hypothetical protein
MKTKTPRILVALLLSLAAAWQARTAAGQTEQRPVRVSVIDFYGYGGLDVDRVRAALPVHEGETFPSVFALAAMRPQIEEAVRRVVGRPATDVAPTCCDAQGGWLIFVGLPGSSSRNFRYNPAPTGTLRLPPQAVELYRQTMDVVLASVQHGSSEDHSRGYALSSDPTLRAKQLATREYAVGRGPLLRRVLAESRDDEQRVVAAHFLGYARQSREQIAALVRASRDPNDGVRNNATRALIVLALSGPKVAARIPAAGFIEMLNSGVWTDRNKSGGLLEALSRSREPKLLAELRAGALDSLLEMARWRAPHAYESRVLLGRIAGIEETRLQKLAKSNDQAEVIIKAVEQKH